MPEIYSVTGTSNVLTTVSIPQSHLDLLGRPIFGVLSTMLSGGQPKSSLVWVDYDGKEVLINTTLERQKSKNMLANAKVTVLVVDPANTGRSIEVSVRNSD